MPYILRWSRNTTKSAIIVNGQTINSTSTSINLYGKGASNYGQGIQENLMRMLENWASTTSPQYPTTGQLWYDLNTSILKIYNGSAFVTTSTPLASINAPTSPVLGTLWYDVSINLYKYWNGTAWNVLFDPASISSKLDKSGGVMTGALTLSGAPTELLHATSKQYVDQSISLNLSKKFYLHASIPGKVTANMTVWTFCVPVGISLPTALAGSYAHCAVQPATNTTFSINKNGTQIGTINWTAGSTSGSFTFNSGVVCVGGDVLTVTTGTSVDTQLSAPAWTISTEYF